MKSSYKENFYGPLLAEIVRFYKPRAIIEFGILDGYSLDFLIKGSSDWTSSITSYDLFEDYPFKHSSYNKMKQKYGDIIQRGDFFQEHSYIPDNSIDLIHIDISNTGYIYEFAFEHYLPKLSNNGIMLLEGGSEERDKCGWMIRYQKQPIGPVLAKCKYPHFTFLPFPSLTMVQKAKNVT